MFLTSSLDGGFSNVLNLKVLLMEDFLMFLTSSLDGGFSNVLNQFS